jgi:hypothetical protein
MPSGGRLANHGVWPPPTFNMGFPSTTSWRVSLWSQPVRGYKVDRPARGFGWPATLGGHWPVAFAHCLLMSGTPPGWHLFWWNFKFPCNFLKCSNLAPMFLKSNKHLNRGTRLVDKVNTWLFYIFTQHVGAWNWCFMSAKTLEGCCRAVNISSHPQLSYPPSPPKDHASTLTGLHHNLWELGDLY